MAQENPAVVMPIDVRIPYSVGQEEARRHIENVFAGYRNQLALWPLKAFITKERWDGDRVYFEESCCPKIKGYVDVLPDAALIHVDLPDMPKERADLVAKSIEWKWRQTFRLPS